MKTLNITAISEIRAILSERHKLGGDFFTEKMLESWAKKVQFQLNEGNPPCFEIKSWEAISNHTEEHTLSNKCVDVKIDFEIDGKMFSILPDDLVIEIDTYKSVNYPYSDSLTVRTTDHLTLLACYRLPEDTHGDYAEWAEWNGCSFATNEDRKLFQSTIESKVEICTCYAIRDKFNYLRNAEKND